MRCVALGTALLNLPGYIPSPPSYATSLCGVRCDGNTARAAQQLVGYDGLPRSRRAQQCRGRTCRLARPPREAREDRRYLPQWLRQEGGKRRACQKSSSCVVKKRRKHEVTANHSQNGNRRLPAQSAGKYTAADIAPVHASALRDSTISRCQILSQPWRSSSKPTSSQFDLHASKARQAIERKLRYYCDVGRALVRQHNNAP